MAILAGDVWPIVRAWAERVPFDYPLAARLGGWDVITVRNKAKNEGWAVAGGGRFRPSYDRAQLQRARNRLWAQLTVVADRPSDDPLAKSDLDALQVQMRVVDMLEKGMESQEQQEEDTDIADTLARINQRIIDLARAFAGEIAADGGKQSTLGAG